MLQNDFDLQSLLFATLVQRQTAGEILAQKEVAAASKPIESSYHKIASLLNNNEEENQPNEQLSDNTFSTIESTMSRQSNIMKQLLTLKSLEAF
ncbi:MAG: hypothetical protein M0P43_09950 [Arcobacteraceae bacterium]|jgi:hypothetical protein|nr:hypothetical protein [Arcobacteraceae bacterium]MDY0327644.1 hypothetical protein [Arcobacteraceae bacterium]